MNKLMRKLLSTLTLAAAMALPAAALAAPTVSVVPAGEATFVVQGYDLQNVGGIDFTVGYDTSTLANPRVAQGSLAAGALMMPNPGMAGAVRVAIISTTGISGSGPLATITFDLRGSSPGNVQSIIGRMIDAKSQPMQATFLVTPRAGAAKEEGTAAGGSSGAPSAGETPAATGQTGSAMEGATGGTAAVPGIAPPPAESAPSAGAGASQPEPLAQEAPAAPAKETQGREEAPAAEESHAAPQGVLDRFRDFQGEETPEALIALVTSGGVPGFTQDPPIALSDGNTKVRITLKVPVSGKTNPDFALEGARLVNLKIQADHSWLLEVLPNKGVYRATLKMMTGQSVTEYPLTVAPPVDLTGGKAGAALSEEDFKHFLAARSTGNYPRYDLDGDGKRTYVDDYIYTLNYIAGTRGSARKTVK